MHTTEEPKNGRGLNSKNACVDLIYMIHIMTTFLNTAQKTTNTVGRYKALTTGWFLWVIGGLLALSSLSSLYAALRSSFAKKTDKPPTNYWIPAGVTLLIAGLFIALGKYEFFIARSDSAFAKFDRTLMGVDTIGSFLL